MEDQQTQLCWLLANTAVASASEEALFHVEGDDGRGHGLRAKEKVEEGFIREVPPNVFG